MIDWEALRDLITFWLPPCLGVSFTLFLLILIWKALTGMRKHKQTHEAITRAYKYFKRVIDLIEKDDNDDRKGGV